MWLNMNYQPRARLNASSTHTHTHIRCAYLIDQVGQEGIALIVRHSVVLYSEQHLEQGTQELQTLEVDGGVGVKEPQGDPAQQQV